MALYATMLGLFIGSTLAPRGSNMQYNFGHTVMLHHYHTWKVESRVPQEYLSQQED